MAKKEPGNQWGEHVWESSRKFGPSKSDGAMRTLKGARQGKISKRRSTNQDRTSFCKPNRAKEPAKRGLVKALGGVGVLQDCARRGTEHEKRTKTLKSKTKSPSKKTEERRRGGWAADGGMKKKRSRPKFGKLASSPDIFHGLQLRIKAGVGFGHEKFGRGRKGEKGWAGRGGLLNQFYGNSTSSPVKKGKKAIRTSEERKKKDPERGKIIGRR